MQTLLLDRTGAPARIGVVRFHVGDWREAWWQWPERAALISDPPYGQKYKSSWAVSRNGTKRLTADSVMGDDDTHERDAALAQPWDVAAIWGPRRLDLIPPWSGPLDEAGRPTCPPIEVLAHDKGGIGMGDLSIPWKPSWETIAIYGRGWDGNRTNGVLRGAVAGWAHKHPNQKPLQVCAELVTKAPEGLAVVDPFAGSGQIPLAAALLGRDVYAAELNPRHAENAIALLRSKGVKVLRNSSPSSRLSTT